MPGVSGEEVQFQEDRLIPGRITKMKNYVCDVCGYVYEPENGDPDNGIDPGTAFDDLPDDWTCPVCGADKDQFSPEE